MKNQGYSEEIQAEVRALVKKWIAVCKKTAAFKALPKSARADFSEVVNAFAELMYVNHLQTVEYWTAAALENVLTSIFPRKIMMSATFFSSVEPCLSVFFACLRNNDLLTNHTALLTRLKTSSAKMRRLIEEPAGRSAAKQNASEPTGANGRQPDSRWRWSAQHDQGTVCPCGSGKTYGACCCLEQIPAEPSLSQWEELYDVATNLKNLSLWAYLGSGDLITILLPEREEPVFCSVMGRNGECYAIGVYPGYEAIINYNRMASAPAYEPPFIYALEQNCLMCYFGDRKEVSFQERKILKELDLHFRGRNEWIYFRSMRPGYYPWYLNAEQAGLLIQVLQNLAMASTYLIDQKIRVDFSGGETLLRFYSQEKELWINAAVKIPPLPVQNASLLIENDVLTGTLKKQEKNETYLEFEVAYLPTPIQESKDAIPYLPKFVLLADKGLDLPLDQHILNAGEPVEAAILNMLTNYIEKHGRPAAIYVRDDRTSRFLEDFCQKINVSLFQGKGVPTIDKLLTGMLEFMRT